MELKDLGYRQETEDFRLDNGLGDFDIGRVVAEHRERYTVRTVQGEYDAEITGNLRFTANKREDFPAVGDWVAMMVFDQDSAVIHQVLPRYSILKRQSVGQSGEVQVIASNIDYALLIQAVDRDFNLNRLERYLAICHESAVSPIVVLTKIDLIGEDDTREMTGRIRDRIGDVPVLAVSNLNGEGQERLEQALEKGKTYCMLGSSGVGKSTLVNRLTEREVMDTASISDHTNKGRHTTTHRELIVLESGGILIDNPGMREVGIADHGKGLELAFEQIALYAQECRYKDCTHTHEDGCAVRMAIEEGDIDEDAYDNYMKMAKEKIHYESTVEERRRKGKELSKILKDYKKKTR